jgi:hypothetical protein
MRMLRNLFVFLLVGGLLYLSMPYLNQLRQAAQKDSIVVSQEDIKLLKDSFYEKVKRQPGSEELDALINSHIYEEIFVNEAMKMELHLADPVIKERLVLNMSFLENGEYSFEDKSAEEQEELFKKALAMGMLETDVVVRKRLKERLEKIITRMSILEPDDNTLKSYLLQNKKHFGLGENVYLFHAFFSKEKTDRQALESYDRQWRAGEISDEVLLSHAQQSYVNPDQALSEYSVKKLFGPQYARKIFTADSPGIMDVYETATGFHFARIEKIIDSSNDEENFQLLKDRLRQEYMREKEAMVLLGQLDSWRKSYDIHINNNTIDEPVMIDTRL